MAQREANLLTSRREGRFVYYRLADMHILDLLQQASELLAVPMQTIPLQLFSCECPNCSVTK
jgi:hypothetical protein